MPRLTAEQVENILRRGEFAADDVGMTREEAEAEKERQIGKRISQLEESHPYFGDPTWPSPIEKLISKAMFYVLNDHPNKDFELRLMAPFTEWEHPRDPRCESVQLITMFIDELVALLPPEALERIEKRRHKSLMNRCRNFPQHDGYLAPHLSESDRKRKLAESAGLKGVRPKAQSCPACRATKIASSSDCAGPHKSRQPVPSENS
jgi:hypothetical protein